jgi:hypothetical protein
MPTRLNNRATNSFSDAFLMLDSDIHRTIRFQSRCAACDEHRNIARALQGKNVLADDTARADCAVQNCFHQRWWKTKFCPEHIRSVFQIRMYRHRLLPNTHVVARSLAESLDNRWLLSKRSAGTPLMEEVLKREKRGRQRRVCLDIETVTNALRSTEIWQIGIVDCDTGQVLIDGYLEHFCPSYCRCRAVVYRFHDTRPEALGKMFKEKKINHFNVLIWGKVYHDMKYPRAYLAKVGLGTLLPPDKQYLLILHQVAANVNFALGLGSMYLAAYPGDRLVENHDDALTDAKMLRNLVNKLEPAWGRGK